MNILKILSLFQGDGAFAIRDIPANTIIAQHAGLRFLNGKKMPLKYQQTGYPYSQAGCYCEGVIFDIPKGYEDIKTYNGSMAHKINHSFDYNVMYECVSTKY